jgi:hypothetical protein
VGPSDPPLLSAAASGLSIDEEGRLLHRGEPITHARTLEVLWGSLTRAADGRYQVQVGRERAEVEVGDAPFGVRAVTLEPGTPRLHLTDGSVESLDPSTLSLGRDGVLRCVVKGGHRARFLRPAQAALGVCLEEPSPGRFAVRVGGWAWPIAPE